LTGLEKSLKPKEGQMTNAEQVTGVRDEHYDVVSILYHALQGAETYQTYITDAERAGDQELVQFFREVQEEERRRAARAKELLGRRLTRR
jgi:rubrerythrin